MPEPLDPDSLKVSKLAGQQIIRKLGSLGGGQFQADNLKNCDVYVFDACDSVTIDDCSNCNFILGPSSGSVFIRDCRNCTVAAASQQLRTRDCTKISLYLFCPTEPIVESSSEIAFLPWNVAIPKANLLFEKASLKPTDKNLYFKVFDFSKADDTIPQPHWTTEPAASEVVEYEFTDGVEVLCGEIPETLKCALGNNLPVRNVKLSSTQAKRISGTVSWYNRAKGFGYVTSTEGFDVFVHRHNLKKGLVLVPNAKVEMTAALQLKGWHIVELLSYIPPADETDAIANERKGKQEGDAVQPSQAGKDGMREREANGVLEDKRRPKKDREAKSDVETKPLKPSSPSQAKSKGNGKDGSNKKGGKEAGTGPKRKADNPSEEAEGGGTSPPESRKAEAKGVNGVTGGKRWASRPQEGPAKGDAKAPAEGAGQKGKDRPPPKKDAEGHKKERAAEMPSSRPDSPQEDEDVADKAKKKAKGKQRSNGEPQKGLPAQPLNITITHYVDRLHQKMKAFLVESGMYVKSLDNQQILRKQIEFDPSSVIIAMEDDTILGTVYVLYNPWQAFVYHLCVHPKHRDKGVANLLMDKAEAQLKARGVRCPTLFVEVDNKATFDFYKRRGWFQTNPYLCMGKEL